MKIVRLIGREIYDSRGCPTLECDLILDSGLSVTASVPSGASRGSLEAFELRDGGTRLGGKGVTKAVEYIEQRISPLLVGAELNAPYLDQKLIELDGTADKHNLGANTILAVSMALFRAQAVAEGADLYEVIAWTLGNDLISLPLPQINLINGGAHADNDLHIQEFMIVPLGLQNVREAIEAGMTFAQELKSVLKRHKKSTAVGDEGGFAGPFDDEFDALNCLMETIVLLEKKEVGPYAIALDVAATQFYDADKKIYKWHGKKRSASDMIAFYQDLLKDYPIFSIEDGLAEDDWDGWQELTMTLGQRIQLVGDDIFVTNCHRIQQGMETGVANAVLIKPNQIGTVTETLQAIQLCKEKGYGVVISHRSGETTDTFIADLAVGSSAGQIKTGGCCRGERVAKYNRLLRIEDTLTRALLER